MEMQQKLIGVFIYLVAKKDRSAIVRTMIGQVLITTDCASEVQSGMEHTTPALPLEILDWIIAMALEDFRNSKDPAAVLKLLHVSSLTRLRVSLAFEAVAVFNCGSQISTQQLLTHPRVADYVFRALSHHLADVTVKRHDLPSPERLECTNFAGTKANFTVKQLSWTVQVATEAVLHHQDGASKPAVQTEECAQHVPAMPSSSDPALTAFDAYDALQAVLRSFSPSTWRYTSIFQRVLDGNWGAPAASTSIQVTLTLPLANDGKVLSTTWCFQT